MTHNRLAKTFFLWIAVLWVAFFTFSRAFAQTGSSSCGPLTNGYGPYDYRTDGDKLPVVTAAHFTEVVESLVRGTTNPRPGDDIDYTLRAIRFHPNDSIVRMTYSTYLVKNGRISEATTQLEIATTYAKENSFTHYNIGLRYFNLKNHDKTLVQPDKAIELRFAQTNLRDPLQSVVKWIEPAESAGPTVAASAPGSTTSTPATVTS